MMGRWAHSAISRSGLLVGDPVAMLILLHLFLSPPPPAPLPSRPTPPRVPPQAPPPPPPLASSPNPPDRASLTILPISFLNASTLSCGRNPGAWRSSANEVRSSISAYDAEDDFGPVRLASGTGSSWWEREEVGGEATGTRSVCRREVTLAKTLRRGDVVGQSLVTSSFRPVVVVVVPVPVPVVAAVVEVEVGFEADEAVVGARSAMHGEV